MKKRNPLVIVLLSIVTFGIYDLYWLVQTKKVLNAQTSHKTPTIWLLVAPVPVIIIGYIILIASGVYNSASTKTYGSTVQPAPHSGTVALAFLILFIGFIGYMVVGVIWFFKFSKAVNEYTHEKMSTAVTFLILWLIHLIGIALIQDAFNGMSTDPALAVSQPAPVATAAQPIQDQPPASPIPPEPSQQPVAPQVPQAEIPSQSPPEASPEPPQNDPENNQPNPS